MSEGKRGELQDLLDLSEQKSCFILFLSAIMCNCTRQGTQVEKCTASVLLGFTVPAGAWRDKVTE